MPKDERVLDRLFLVGTDGGWTQRTLDITQMPAPFRGKLQVAAPFGWAHRPPPARTDAGNRSLLMLLDADDDVAVVDGPTDAWESVLAWVDSVTGATTPLRNVTVCVHCCNSSR